MLNVSKYNNKQSFPWVKKGQCAADEKGLFFYYSKGHVLDNYGHFSDYLGHFPYFSEHFHILKGTSFFLNVFF